MWMPADRQKVGGLGGDSFERDDDRELLDRQGSIESAPGELALSVHDSGSGDGGERDGFGLSERYEGMSSNSVAR